MTNKGTETCDYVQITATFYDANKSINVFGISPGQTQAVSDGIWIILKPLPPGEHKIGFKGTSVDFTTGATNTFVSDVRCNL